MDELKIRKQPEGRKPAHFKINGVEVHNSVKIEVRENNTSIGYFYEDLCMVVQDLEIWESDCSDDTGDSEKDEDSEDEKK